jgi:NTE family protein
LTPSRSASIIAAMNPSDDAAVRHAETTYLPRPARQRSGVALALSGGGYRAALFHLGALRRLNELGVLSRVDTVSSVSGGSIVSAFLASRLQPWPAEGERFDRFEELVATPLKQLAVKNIRTGPIARRLFPWNLARSQTAVNALAERYGREISRLALRDLPEHPAFVYCATDLPFAVNWVFERGRIGDYQAGYMKPPLDYPLARAVAASSCFPPIFSPLQPRLQPKELTGGASRGGQRDEIVRSLSLSDGGVYDNMGLEPVWKSHDVLLVSDGGATFDVGPDRGFFWQLSRYTGVIGNQASAVRKRWLIASFINKQLSGTYWGIGSAAEHYGLDGGYAVTLVDEVISEVRTDLDAFSDAEQAVLENHGYLMAEAALRRHAADLISPDAPTFAVPYPEWMDEARVRVALKDSAKRRLLGRR